MWRCGRNERRNGRCGKLFETDGEEEEGKDVIDEAELPLPMRSFVQREQEMNSPSSPRMLKFGQTHNGIFNSHFQSSTKHTKFSFSDDDIDDRLALRGH
jgi:hypothetical protein